LKTFTAVVLLLCAIHPALAADNYQITKKIPVPGQGGWDYLTVDEGARRLYVSHGTQVEVIDVDSGAVVGKIENTPGVHGIAVAPELGRGFVSNGQAATVTIFDLKTLKKIADVPTGKPDRDPLMIRQHPECSRLMAAATARPSWTPKDEQVAGTVEAGRWSEFAVSDGKGFVFNNLEDEGMVLKIDAKKMTVEQRWKVCDAPSSMAMDRETRRLFIGCTSKVMAVMNADTGKVITTLPIGDHVDATAYDVESKLIFNSNGEGTVTVIRQDGPDTYSVVETVKTLPRAKTMALDPKTHQLFLSTAENGQFEVLVVGK
jgi:DNA-binding beta-propeller fold protein YncE